MNRRIEVDLGGFHLPEEVIQRIQSFLTKEEAVNTTFISEAWADAWSSRPNVEFDQRNFRGKFCKFTEEVIQRYQDRKLKIESFRIFVYNFSDGMDLILKAMKMGAIDITFETRPSSKDRENYRKALPPEVLESKDLVRLSVTGCKIDGEVNWSSLESLSLFKVRIETDTIWDLLSKSHLIEQLVLSDCKFGVIFPSPDLLASKNNILINLFVFRNLKFLVFEKMKFESCFFRGFSSKFPCLKGLDVRRCYFFRQSAQIISPSLENIHIEHYDVLRARFNVPNIRKFSFVGTIVPYLTLKTTSREWESDITITWKAFRTSWFIELYSFLGRLRESMITLSLVLGKMKKVGESFRWPLDSGFKPLVQSLKIGVGSSMSFAVMDAMFWCFHPKCISQLRMPNTAVKERNDFQVLLRKTLIRSVNEDGCIPNRKRRVLHQLVGVNVEVFEDSRGEFQSLIMTDASVFSKREIRFKLQWEIGAPAIH